MLLRVQYFLSCKLSSHNRLRVSEPYNDVSNFYIFLIIFRIFLTIDKYCQMLKLIASLKRIDWDQIMEKVLKIKKAFTLIEVLIIILILGILIILVIPVLSGHIIAAKEGVAKDHLRILRSVVQLYAVQHNGVPPAYILDGTAPEGQKYGVFMEQLFNATYSDGTVADANSGDELTFGPYLTSIPENPFNKGVLVKVLILTQSFPKEYIGPREGVNIIGWIYSAEEKDFRINHEGVDSEGVPFSSY